MTKLAFLAAAAALVTGGASAQPSVVAMADEPSPPREDVRFSYVSLETAAGQKRLIARIRGAARRVCTEPGSLAVHSYLARRDCVDAAFEDGVAQMQRILVERKLDSEFAAVTLTIRGQ